MAIKHTLVELADELDKVGALKYADELDELIKEVDKLEKAEEAGVKVDCSECDGKGYTDETPFCELCSGTGKVSLKEAGLNKISYIRRRGKDWVVYSKKGKVLGKYPSKKKALERLRQIEFFKHNK
jgi:RecJ-like exonuclease